MISQAPASPGGGPSAAFFSVLRETVRPDFADSTSTTDIYRTAIFTRISVTVLRPFLLHLYHHPPEPRMTEDDTHSQVSTTCEEVQCLSNDHLEDDVDVEVESHCGGGCCADADDKDSDCESGVDHCQDSCCENHEDNDICEEPVHMAEQRGIFHIPPPCT